MSEIKVDTVAEKTSANGVTVDGLSIKDSKLVTANSVIPSNITDDNVTYGKIQNVSATNRILGRDSANAGIIEEITPANLRTMLNVADGANVGGGSIIKLQTQTASTSSTITFSSTYLTTTYKKYYLDYTDIVISSDGGNISATVSENNGSSYTTSGYYYWRIISNSGTSNNTIASGGGTNNSALLMLGTGTGIGTGADESGSGRMTIFNPNNIDSKLFISEGLHIGDGGQLCQQNIYQGLKTSTTINNIKISPNTGTIVSGIFTLYGVTT